MLPKRNIGDLTREYESLVTVQHEEIIVIITATLARNVTNRRYHECYL